MQFDSFYSHPSSWVCPCTKQFLQIEVYLFRLQTASTRKVFCVWHQLLHLISYVCTTYLYLWSPTCWQMTKYTLSIQRLQVFTTTTLKDSPNTFIRWIGAGITDRISSSYTLFVHLVHLWQVELWLLLDGTFITCQLIHWRVFGRCRSDQWISPCGKICLLTTIHQTNCPI